MKLNFLPKNANVQHYLLFLLIFKLLASIAACSPSDPLPSSEQPRNAAAQISNIPWTRISFPELPAWNADVSSPAIWIENDKEAGMLLFLRYSLPSEGYQKKHGVAKMDTVAATLWLKSGGRGTLPTSFDIGPRPGSGPTIDLSEQLATHRFSVPWGINDYEDAWIVIALKKRKFLIELPYGFHRNPADPIPPKKPNDGIGGFPFTNRNEFGPEATIVPWDHVTYKVGEYEGKLVEVNFSNPFNAAVELALSGFQGDVRKPVSSITVAYDLEHESPGNCTFLSVIEDGSYREQLFRFGTSPYDGRRECSVRIAVDDWKCSFYVPSSLFSLGHGHIVRPNNIASLKIHPKWTPR